MANYPAYPYGTYQNPYYPQQMQGQMNPMSMQQGQQIQPQMVQQPQVTQATQPSNMYPPVTGGQGNGIIWVPNFSAANDYLVAANNAVALWDASSPFVYLKQADASGKPTIKAFELVERDPNQKPDPQPQPQVQLPDFDQFVKRDDLRGFITRDDLEEIITERLKKPVKPTGKKEDKDDA